MLTRPNLWHRCFLLLSLRFRQLSAFDYFVSHPDHDYDLALPVLLLLSRLTTVFGESQLVCFALIKTGICNLALQFSYSDPVFLFQPLLLATSVSGAESFKARKQAISVEQAATARQKWYLPTPYALYMAAVTNFPW